MRGILRLFSVFFLSFVGKVWSEGRKKSNCSVVFFGVEVFGGFLIKFEIVGGGGGLGRREVLFRIWWY